MAKIMIVEDEAVIRQLIGEELTKWRFDVYQTTDFNQVFDEFEQIAPQLRTWIKSWR
jgi:DNA-binding response OmpR family regulator